MRGSRLTLAAAASAAACGLLVLAAPAAQAHDQTLPSAEYFRSTITAVTPQIPGLSVQIGPTGEWLTVTNHSATTVEVLGYVGEPYLRVGPSGVEENQNSLSSFLNGSLIIQGLPQDSNETSKPPVWKHISNNPTYRYHDHRTHWMSDQLPPLIAADPTHPHPVFDWTVRMTADGQPLTVKGNLAWAGRPASSILTIALAVIITIVVLLAGFLLVTRARVARRMRREHTELAHARAGEPVR